MIFIAHGQSCKQLHKNQNVLINETFFHMDWIEIKYEINGKIFFCIEYCICSFEKKHEL
jgi:hypothetical protein